jgi:hypothetical protein
MQFIKTDRLLGGSIWQRTGMLGGHLPILVPNHDVRISGLRGWKIAAPPRRIVILAVAKPAGDDLIRTVERPKPIDGHDPRSLLWRGPPTISAAFLGAY